jgi:hypothetical protein
MVFHQDDQNDQASQHEPTRGGQHVGVAMIDAVFAGLASMYMATGSVGFALIGTGLSLVPVWLAIRGQRI